MAAGKRYPIPSIGRSLSDGPPDFLASARLAGTTFPRRRLATDMVIYSTLRGLIVSVYAAFALSALIAFSAHAQTTIAISCSSLGVEAELCRTGAEEWARRTGNKITLVSTPADANERFSLYLTLLAAESPDVDIFQIDTTWPGMLANHFVDLAPTLSVAERADHLNALIANNTVGGKLIALPFFVDAGMLYFRKDLLDRAGSKPPETWSELAETAAMIMRDERAAGRSDMQGFVWQGRAYEGLVCNALEWIASEGGALIDKDGGVVADSEATRVALERARSWIGTISPRGVLNYGEEDARSAFQSGKAVFMRNWPYAWALANADDSPVKGKVGVTVLPRGEGAKGRHAATLGGQQLAVSRYSRHRNEAIDLVRFLTGRDEQKRRALKASFNPTRRSLYADPELLAANPFYSDYLATLEQAVLRPSAIAGRQYNRVANEVIQAVHDTLTGQGAARANIKALDQALRRMSRDAARR